MKKQLLLGSALLAAISAFPQHGRVSSLVSGHNELALELSEKYASQNNGPKSGPVYQGPQMSGDNSTQAQKGTATNISWNLLCGSANTYGMIVSHSRPLQYNAALNVVTFIHRKSFTYLPYPLANDNVGVIVAEVSSNWGQSWDSTCIWSDATNAGRYPQGAIYNPPGNSDIANAYVVGCGPVVANSAFTGNWYGSKKLGAPGTAAYNNTASAVPGAQQFLSFTLPTYPANQAPHGWPRYGFTAIDGGPVRTLANLQDDNSTLKYAEIRGLAIVKGAFNAGVFAWTVDTINPDYVIDGIGRKMATTDAQMAWNNSGTVGYIIQPGTIQTSQNSNRGFQPILYKTTNSGASWSPMTGINFNNVAMKPVLDHLHGTPANPQVKIPYLYDFDITVDANDYLHIGATLCSAQSSDDDSLFAAYNYTPSSNASEEYSWNHTPGNRPYLYDFVGNGTAPWVVGLIDSVSSEAPSSQSGGAGFNDNPWDNNAGSKMQMDTRIQMGHTPDGKFVTISWVETDSAFVPGSKKWNVSPNIKARAIAITSTLATGNFTNFCAVSENEFNVTKPSSTEGTANPNVQNRATLHYMSPTAGPATVTTNQTCISSAEFNVPFTVTNSNPYSQLTNNTTWYSSARMNFQFKCTVGINELQSNSVNASFVYPNPANGNAYVRIDLNDNEKIQVSVMNLVGQVVKSTNATGQIGENNINVDLSGLTSGIYMVNVKVGNITSTKKLVVN